MCVCLFFVLCVDCNVFYDWLIFWLVLWWKCVCEFLFVLCVVCEVCCVGMSVCLGVRILFCDVCWLCGCVGVCVLSGGVWCDVVVMWCWCGLVIGYLIRVFEIIGEVEATAKERSRARRARDDGWKENVSDVVVLRMRFKCGWGVKMNCVNEWMNEWRRATSRRVDDESATSDFVV